MSPAPGQVPVGAPQAPAPQGPAPQTGAIDWRQLLSVLPALISGIRGNGMAANAFMEGYQQARQRKAQAVQQQQSQGHAQALLDLQRRQEQRLEDAERADLMGKQLAQRERHRQQQIEFQLGLAKALEGVTSKPQYDRVINLYAPLLETTPASLMATQPFSLPAKSKDASAAVQAFLANPANREMVQNHPEDLAKQRVTYDKDGDGIPEHVPLLEAAQHGGVDFALDPATGEPPRYPKGTTLEEKVSAAAIYEELVRKAKAEGKPIEGDSAAAIELRNTLRTQALQTYRDATTRQPAAVGTGQDDIGGLAQQLLDGHLLPSTLSKRGTSYNAILNKANQLSLAQTGKPLNLLKLQLDYTAAQRFAGSLNGPQMLRFRGLADSVVNTIDEVRRLSNELKQGSVQLWNRAKRTTVQQVYGNTPQSALAAQYVAAVNTLKEEFANLINGGYAPTEAAFTLANQQVNGDYGLRDMDASLTEVQRLINYRQQAFEQLAPLIIGQPPGGTTPPSPPALAAPGQRPTYRFNPVTGQLEPI